LETKIGKHKVILYSDIEETPSLRYSKFNKYMILNEKVGSNFAAADNHFSKLYALINEPAKLKLQLDLFRQLVYSLDKEQSFNSLAYACLVKSIDGISCNDLTVNGLNSTLEKLQWLKAKELKKKRWNTLKPHMRNLKKWIKTYSIKAT